MEKSIILLLWIQYVFKISESFHYIPKNKQATTIFIEWDEFPKGGSPEFYFLKYQLVNNFAQKNVKRILADPQKLPKSIITLEESEDCHIIIQSIKYGQILSEKSFQTRGISTRNIKTIATSTSVSFNWSVLSSNDTLVSISLNNSSQIMQNNVMFYEWDDLKPATLYVFTFEFKQLHLDFINIFQRRNVQIETGSCSQGWVALKNNCYRISKENKPWNIAQQHCKLSLISAHLVDIKNEEEKKFMFSHLRSKNQIIIWTGLNDLKKEGHLTWTDGSSFGLKKNEIFSFPLLPKNETDCYILQQNATGSNYFFTRFFCYVPLPYICEYESPSPQENLLFYVKDVGTTEVVFSWNNLSGWNNLNKWLKLGYKIIIKYYLDYTEEQHFESVPPNTTEKAITQLSPGRVYRFLFSAISEWEAKTTLSPVFIVETCPLSAQNITVTHVTPTEIFLHWDAPDPVSFHHYFVAILDVVNNKSEEVFVEKFNTSTTIGNLRSFHHYLIYLFSVAERGTLSCFEKPISAITGINPPQKVYAKLEDVGEDSIILQWGSPQDGHEVYIQIKSISDRREVKKLFVKDANRVKVDHLIPGMTYDIGMATVMNGNLSELVTIQQTLKPKPVQIVIPYESHSTSVILFVQMPDIGVFDGIHIASDRGPNVTRILKQDSKITVDNLTPGTEYNFFVSTISGTKLSNMYYVPAVKTCLEAPSNIHEGKVTNSSIEILWNRADGNFQHYEITCVNCAAAFMVQKVFQEAATFSNLDPGTVYTFSIRTEKEGFKDSSPYIKEIQTAPSAVEFLNHSRNSNAVTVSWPSARSLLDGYIISISSESLMKEEILPSTKRTFSFNSLSPGTDFLISIIATRGLKRSRPTVLMVSTYPDPPSDLLILGQEEHTIYLSWKLPQGGFERFQISYCMTSRKEKLFKVIVYSNKAKVKNLTPGMEYLFHVKTVRGKDYSISVMKKVATKPSRICGLTLKAVNTSSANLMWNPTETNFTHYKIYISNRTFAKEYLIWEMMTEHTVTDLTPGRTYNITVHRVSGNVEGSGTFIRVVAEPEKPEKLKAFNISAHSFSLHWSLPSGHVDGFHVDLVPDSGFVTIKDLGGGEYQVDVSNAVPGTRYDVTVSSISATTYSLPVSRTVTTNVTKPGPPVFLAGERVGSAGILLSWNTPPNPNGRIISYIVKYKEVCPWMQAAYTQVRAKPDSLEVLLTNLNPGTTYEIKVAAENSAGIGVFSDPFLFQTAESAPGKVVNLTVEAFNYSAVSLIWYLPRQPNGKITSFKISVKHARSGIVVEDVSIRVEDILTGKLPECIENNESFLWSTTSPSPTLGRVTPPSRTTYPSSMLPGRKINSVWKEPISFVVTHLQPYTTYLFEVSAVTTEAGYIDSTIVRTPESVPEGPPQNFVTGNITGKSFSVSWDPPTTVTGKFSYRVELYGPSGQILDNSTKDLKFAFTNLTPFTKYDVCVAAETSAGIGPKSNISVFTPPGVPGTVFDLQVAEVEATEISITWKKPRQPNGIINQYRVKVLVSETGVILENTLLTGKDEYIKDPMAPETVNIVESMAGLFEGSAEMSSDLYSIASVMYNSHPHNNFPVRSRAEDQPSTVGTSRNQYIADIAAEQLSYVIRRLVPFTEHMISVSAFTIMGEGPPTVLNVRTREQVPSSIQVINYKNISSSSILLYWDPPEYPNGKITHYTIYAMELDTNRAFQMTTIDNSFLITGLKKYTKYKMRVAASTSVGESSLSEANDIFVRTPEDEPESSPQDVEVIDVTASEISLKWSPPEKPSGIIVAYEVLYKNIDALFMKNTSTTNIILTDLKPYTLYNISVRSYTRFGHGNQLSSLLSVRTSETVPDSAPENITYKNISSGEIELSFFPPNSPNGIIQKYTIYLKKSNGSEERTINTTSLTQNIKGLKKYTQYIIEVSASTLKGEGVRSAPISVLTEEDAPDSPPQDFSVKQLSGVTVQLSWQPPLEPNGIILYYTVYVWDISSLKNINVTETSLEFSDLDYNVEYSAYVTASTRFGDGKTRSSIINFRTPEGAPSDPPKDVHYANLSSSSVLLFWTPPSKPNGIIQYYSVYYRNTSGTFVQNFTLHEVTNDFDNMTISAIIDKLAIFSYYTFWVTASTSVGNGNKSSDIVQVYTDQDMPLAPPQNLTLVNYTSDLVWLKWSPSPVPGGIVKVYSLKIHEHETDTIFYKDISGFQTEAKLVGLEPVSTYSISISAFTKVGNGNQFSNVVKFTTQESVPDVVQNVQCMATSWQSALVKWDPPKKANGIITHYMITVERNATKISPQDHMYTFMKLLANTSYVFKIRASTSAGEGDESACNMSTLPETVPSIPTNIAFSNVQSTSATLTWMRPDTIFGYFQNYKITTQLRAQKCKEWESEECVEYQKIQYLYEVDLTEETVYDLKKFRWYRFQVAASTNAGYGDASNWISTQTLPGPPDGPPENVYVVAASPFSININWSEPAVITGPTFYLIDVKSVDSDEFNISLIKSNGENKTIEIEDLKIFTRYSVVITAFTGNISAAHVEGKSSAEVIVTTLESVPKDPPNNMTFQKIPDEVTKFQLTFLPPSQPNGNIQVYQALVYREDDPTAVQIRNLSIIQKTDTSVIAMLEGLKGGRTYNISVYAINSAGAGPKVQMRITMDIKAPARPKTKPTPIYDATGKLLVTSTTITIRMPICYYNDDHGPIKNVQVLVAEAGAQHDGNVTKWYDAYFNKPRPYFTNEGFPNPPCTEEKTKFSGNEEIYIIGADNACMIPGNEDKICNGPLKPKKQYLFKFRATNVMGQFTDSDYSDPVKTLGEGLSERSVEIILSVTLCILSIILLGTAIFAFARIRQKQKEGGTYSPRDAEIIDTKFNLDQLITVADLELKDERLTRPISKKSFLQHVEELCTNNNLKFQEEFSELPKFLQDLSSTDADLPWNRAKNRFPNIKPYNNNRVKLIADASIPGSDYINASYVSGYLCPNEFIATQGPLPGTVGDFWRMVWETRAKTLVMLTQCFEKGRIRCHQYWPEDNKPVTVFGDIVITKLMEDVQIDWTIRDLKIERHGDCMTIRQCNFTAWPEHGVPENSAPLVHFVKLVRASRAHDTTPMVVHCSAGVGRTGVFIALDHLTQHINDHDFVDIYGLVAELRSERMCMVQNLAQYIFLHQCVLDLLSSKGSNQPICFVNYSALQKMDSLDAMEGDVELEWEETTM
ncbi:phosphatidylinositol phosphatase PTPRQ isoform X1 [Eubalaena glacialis]|uniref:phosphatidylinositol phosphatase PTPRQ isoform X1 n=1 Tax=Eubalaena glacialis TaxID=27606 RepID=UPI002A5AFFA8|nr:phosphatidylinositol phosphatase PTPRQ isoform X1 [Eubalaena glacialis]XP_061060849.1 phosphatidylinositol phosphatase PTPRQ isoform X1 [Eubalaena glacialis]XP_061060850.1 phosphatidylinositol phosphatase PTPRQ isoform X1 [Eubalaena glacialis]